MAHIAMQFSFGEPTKLFRTWLAEEREALLCLLYLHRVHGAKMAEFHSTGSTGTTKLRETWLT